MMLNIFSIFDPTSSFSMSLNWMSIPLLIMFMPFQFWLLHSRLSIFYSKMISYFTQELKILIKHSKSNIIVFVSLYIFIFFNNFLGLFPYIFTPTSHMTICLSLSLSLWFGMITFSIMNYLSDLLSHLTPLGTPTLLMPFMVLIESISLFIRPITLAIRLTANMIAGHLLLSLLGSAGSTISNHILFQWFILSQILLYLLEIAVSMIQAYVFSILATLYSSET